MVVTRVDITYHVLQVVCEHHVRRMSSAWLSEQHAYELQTAVAVGVVC